jgi:cytochrome c-type biogenesis protein
MQTGGNEQVNFDIGLGGAFIAGLLSFVSPCVLPLVPPYLFYLAGISLEEFHSSPAKARASRRVFFSAFAFVVGFSIVFISLGASASFIGKIVQDYYYWLSKASGILIILMGLHFLGIFKIALLHRHAQIEVAQRPAGIPGAFVMGLAFAFGWSPCVGPVLATILVGASVQDTVGEGVKLLGAYSIGIGVPFLFAAAFVSPFMRFMDRFRRHLDKVEKIIGALLVVTGVLFMTGAMNTMAYFLLQYMPWIRGAG